MTTEVFCDREFDTKGTSSVIKHVFYSTERKMLFVELVRGYVIASYQDVPPDVYTALSAINDNRIKHQDESASVGRYWNQWIKPYFPGVESDDFDIVTQSDIEKRAIENVQRIAKETKEKLNSELLPFAVTIEDEDEDTELSVLATDYQQAIEKVKEAAAILGWGPVKIVSVTLYLEA